MTQCDQDRIKLYVLRTYQSLVCIGALYWSAQPKLQDKTSKFFSKFWVATDEVEECAVMNVEGRKTLARGECLADAAQRSLQ